MLGFGFWDFYFYNLKFDLHFDNCINKVNRLIGDIFRNLVCLDKFLSLLIQNNYWPHSCAWQLYMEPLYKRQSFSVENIQSQSYKKKIREIQDVTYEERL